MIVFRPDRQAVGDARHVWPPPLRVSGAAGLTPTSFSFLDHPNLKVAKNWISGVFPHQCHYKKRRTLSFFTGAFKVGDKIASSFKDVRRNMEPNETQTSGGCPTNQCLSNHLGLIMFSIMQNKTLLKLVPGCSLC